MLLMIAAPLDTPLPRYARLLTPPAPCCHTSAYFAMSAYGCLRAAVDIMACRYCYAADTCAAAYARAYAVMRRSAQPRLALGYARFVNERGDAMSVDADARRAYAHISDALPVPREQHACCYDYLYTLSDFSARQMARYAGAYYSRLFAPPFRHTRRVSARPLLHVYVSAYDLIMMRYCHGAILRAPPRLCGDYHDVLRFMLLLRCCAYCYFRRHFTLLMRAYCRYDCRHCCFHYYSC